MSDQYEDKDHGPNPGEVDSTERATQAAVPVPRQVPHRELPTLGELDGEFYFHKRINGAGEIPDSVHQDSHPEVIRMAEANGWLATGDVRVHEARSLGDAWDVYYAVPVRPNNGPIAGDQQHVHED